MEVPQSAVNGHLGHGDHLGPCEESPTTTTTAAPTTTSTTSTTSTSTSTTTPTTSTSTSTTSTSTTTPMCIPNGGSCSTSSDCCSGICKGATAASAGQCVTDRLCIPQGTVVCNTDADCTGPGCTCQVEPRSLLEFCSGALTTTRCTTSCDCPTGQFCAFNFAADQGFCAPACFS
jgi:hypothetical protein